MKESTMWLRVMVVMFIFCLFNYNVFMQRKHSSVRGATNADRVLERGTEMHVHILVTL